MKLKRILISALSLLMLTSVALFAACKSEQEAKLVEISYLSGMPEYVWVNKTLDYSSLKINAVYDDETSKEIVYDAESFTVTVDTSVVNSSAEVAITYGGKECKTTISVIEYEIAGVELPEFAATYNGVVAPNSAAKFMDKTQGYIVGNANPFYFNPNVTYYDEDDEQYSDAKVAVNADVYFYQNDEEVAIDNPSDYYTLNSETAAFNFTSAAEDKTFLIRVYPQSLTEAQLENKANYSVDFTFTVKDKYYNVYNAVDLLVFDNRKEVNSTESDGTAMYNFRAEKGLDNNAITGLEGIALHNNISLSDSDFPKEYFWQESELTGLTAEQKAEIKGSLKDNTMMLFRDLGQNGKFTFEGNYFTINADEISMVRIEKISKPDVAPNMVIVHSKLFYVFGQSAVDETNYTEEAAFNNISFIGNLNRSESDYSGGLICMGAQGAKTHIYNNIANSWYITTFSTKNSTDHGVTVEKTIYEDDYNSIFYVWGGFLDIKESIIRRAGGPLIIADHGDVKYSTSTGRKDGKGGWPAVLNFDEYTSEHMYSYVTGQESWFVQMGATSISAQAAGMLGALNAFAPTHPYVKTETGEGGTPKTLINAIAVYKDPGTYSYDTIGQYATSGKATFGSHTFDFDDPIVKQILGNETVKAAGLPLFYGTSSQYITGINPTSDPISYYGLTATGGFAPYSDPRKLPVVQGQGIGSFLNMFLRPNKGSAGALGVIFGDCTVAEEA